jgi:poly-beta-hydroxyalkanoate depolymerase
MDIFSNQMFDKQKNLAIKAVDFNKEMADLSLKFFDEITEKYFYTYTLKASEMVKQGTENAKEFIKTGAVKTVFGNSTKN